MLNWFYRYLGTKIRSADQDCYVNEVKLARSTVSVRDSDDLSSNPINFRMYKANGGWVVEFRQYDHKTDRHGTALYVINNEEDLGNNISKIITMEALKR